MWCQPALRRVPVGMSETYEHSADVSAANAQAVAGEGRGAATPACIPVRGWRQVLRRCAWRVFDDRLLGEAAAVAFYALLAVFPALAALLHGSGRWRCRSSRSSRTTPHLPPGCPACPSS